MTFSSHKFEVIAIECIAFLYLLLDELVDDTVGFPTTGTSHHNAPPLRGYDINPAIVPLFLVIETCRQVHRIFIGDQAGFLHEALVLIIKDVIHELVLQQTGNPDSGGKQADISGGYGSYI